MAQSFFKQVEDVKKKSPELLEENSGYNPEPAINFGKPSASKGVLLIFNDVEGSRFYDEVDSKDLLDHITRYSGQFAVFHRGKFYVAA